MYLGWLKSYKLLGKSTLYFGQICKPILQETPSTPHSTGGKGPGSHIYRQPIQIKNDKLSNQFYIPPTRHLHWTICGKGWADGVQSMKRDGQKSSPEFDNNEDGKNIWSSPPRRRPIFGSPAVDGNKEGQRWSGIHQPPTKTKSESTTNKDWWGCRQATFCDTNPIQCLGYFAYFTRKRIFSKSH